VARRAGVSQSAVSRTFTPGASVSEATRAKVMEAARALGYSPNAIARSLITRRSRMIGVIVALCLQAAALIFWGGGLSARMTAVEQAIEPLSSGTPARLDERTKAMQDQLDRIEKEQ
jgi:DNA-binding LacI/PurR family transcriptional regulator